VLLSLLLDERLLVTTLAGGGELGTRETTAGGVHALDAVTLLDLGHGGSLVAAVDAGGCGLLISISFVMRTTRESFKDLHRQHHRERCCDRPQWRCHQLQIRREACLMCGLGGW
jgi:hypothetical protein